MSKFFSYEERLDLQKFLKDCLSFKEISRRLDKNPTTISREVRKYSSQIATGYPGFPFNACKNRFHCRRKKSVAKNVVENLIYIANFANPVIRIVLTLSKKSVLLDFGFHMFVMGVKQLVNALF